jgi:hypothetical protein
MSERNDKSEQEIGEEQDIKRWTAKRRAALSTAPCYSQQSIYTSANASWRA